MRKIAVVLLVILFTAGTIAAYAGQDKGCAASSGAKKGGWQTVYDDISNWGQGAGTSKSSVKSSSTGTPKKGTEPTAKN